MSSLTETSILSRKAIRYAVYLLIFGLIARTLFNVGKGIYLKIFPPKPPEVTVPFNVLPKLPFPEKIFPDNLNFKVETADGKFPVFPNQLFVYLMPPIPQNINALDDAKAKATQLEFNPNGRPILESTPNVYLFQKQGVPSTLTMNIITGVFSISYDVGQDPSVLVGLPPEPERASDQIKSYLQGANLMPAELQKGVTAHQFLKAEGKDLIPVDSLSEANLIKINLFRKNYGLKDDITSVTPKFPQANVWFIIGSNSRQVIAGEYHYYPIDANKSGTYPLLTAEEAWENLKSKKGYIVNLGNNSDGNITVRKIYLAYYDAGQYAQYYQPVVVFEGDNDFIAYVPAVQEKFYGADASTEGPK